MEHAVARTPGGPADETIGAQLCLSPSADTIEILVPGASYDARYWDFALRWPDYSYVRLALRSGFTTLAIDPIGRRLSSKPPAHRVTFDASVFALHQVIQAARAGRFGTGIRRIVVVGHSLGAATAIVEAARYQDVDGVILSGFLAHAVPAGAPSR